MARNIRREIDEHFGLNIDNYDFEAVAERVRGWFDRGWHNLAEPVTIFVALLNEGVDAWRPVLPRPLDGGLYRIVGVDADTTDETWRSPAGVIVKCEHKQFADGTTGMTAVAQFEEAG